MSSNEYEVVCLDDDTISETGMSMASSMSASSIPSVLTNMHTQMAPVGDGFACPHPGCNANSIRGAFESMSLRMDAGGCMAHIDTIMIGERMDALSDAVLAKLTIIFVDVETNEDFDEISQLGAVSELGDRFNESIRVTGRDVGRSFVNALPRRMQRQIRTKPTAAFQTFIEWCRSIHRAKHGEGARDELIVLAAHNGAMHDFVLLTKSMMARGIPVPNFSLTDTLVITKNMEPAGASCKLSALMMRHAPWLTYVAHDAAEDASALMHVMMYFNKDWRRIMAAHSCTMTHYLTSIGLDTQMAMNPSAGTPASSSA